MLVQLNRSVFKGKLLQRRDEPYQPTMSSPNPIHLLFLLQAILLIPLARAQSSIFSEYIGALFNGVKFSDVPINSSVDFRFILSFAIDYTTTTSPPSPTNGNFSVFWDSTSLSPADVSSIKQAHPNVKVGLSLGGDSVGDNLAYFNPTSADSWVSNAVSSLTTIIQEYHIDAIDIDYEHFQADSSVFADCIGRLITTLKRNGVITLASIAPFDSSEVQSHYQALWADYGSSIDEVNFQFYAYSSSTTASQFLDYYDAQRNNYAGGRVLVSFTTGGDGGLSPKNGFFDACRTLKEDGKLAGIFVWSADNSKSSGFQYETEAQDLLAS